MQPQNVILFSQESEHVVRTQKAFLISNQIMCTDPCIGAVREDLYVSRPSIIIRVMSVRSHQTIDWSVRVRQTVAG